MGVGVLAGTTSASSNVGLRATAGVAAATVTGFALAMFWVAHRVTSQLHAQSSQAAGIRLKLASQLTREQALKAKLRDIVRHDRMLAQQQSQTAKVLRLEHQQVVSMEESINRTITKIDDLTHAPLTNLLPISSAAKVGGVGQVSLPPVPASSPTVHATTGASGVP